MDCVRRVYEEGGICIKYNAERNGRKDEPILNFSMISHPQYRLPSSQGSGLMSSWCFGLEVADATDVQPAMKRRNGKSRSILSVMTINE